MDLPRDCSLRVVKHLDIDTRMALHIPPGRLQVPQALLAALQARPQVLHTQYSSTTVSTVYLRSRYILKRATMDDGEACYATMTPDWHIFRY